MNKIKKGIKNIMKKIIKIINQVLGVN